VTDAVHNPSGPIATDLTDEDRARLVPYVSDTTGPVFALTNLPETVKGALFARYSRSPKSLRRLLVDEFLTDAGEVTAGAGPGQSHADALYQRVLADYGDDSVAQLGGAHVAVEGASNVLTKILQWGRLASYLEQSTRYIAYTDRPGGHWRYYTPPDVAAHARIGPAFTHTGMPRYRSMTPRPRRASAPCARGRSTACAGYCPPPRAPMWASLPRVRPMRRCCCG
jgi:hypothetical protein